MKRHLAHVLRRIARVLIGWSNRLDKPCVTVYDREWNSLGSLEDWERANNARVQFEGLR